MAGQRTVTHHYQLARLWAGEGGDEPGAICPYLYTTAASWYSGQATGLTFLVVHPADPGVDVITASPAARLGVPLEKVVLGGWRIFVYADDIAARFLPGASVPGQPQPVHG